MEQTELDLRDRSPGLCFRRLAVLLDLSAASSTYIIHIQHSLRLLLEEQLANKDTFNLIA